jgi:heptosyltransferase I
MPAALLIRISSLGDVVQTFPAATDLLRARPDVRLEWVVEEAYEPLVKLHPGVARTLPFALRRWRNNIFASRSWEEISILFHAVRLHPYEAVIDSQGLLKSLAVAKMAKGPLHGFGKRTVREPWLARFYNHTYEFPPAQHRVLHYRGLLAKIFGYEPDAAIDYGLRAPPQPAAAKAAAYCVLLHSTARAEKLWPEAQWIALGRRLHARGLVSMLPWGNADEQARAQRLAAAIPGACLMPALSLPEAAGLLAHARCVIGVDTGLMHLAVAYAVPVVGIYLATRPGHHGPLGAGPTAVCGGMEMNPEVDEVFGHAQRLLDA